MISVQNHQPLLSGNRIVIFILFSLILLGSSCKSKKGLYYEDEPGAVVGNGVDTIVWNNKPSDYPPIKDETVTTPVKPVEPKPDPKDPVVIEPDEPIEVKPTEPVENHQYSYDVAYLLPFYTNKSAGGGPINSSSSIKSLEFYTGAKMALDKLSGEGVNMRVYSYDTQGSSSRTNSIMSNPEFSGMDLIFGPMKTDPLKSASTKVKGGNTILVSPWNPKTSITSRNPNYVQVSPSLKTHCQSIMKHVKGNHNMNNVVLACREGTNENKYFRYFQEYNKVLSGSTSVARMPELIAEYGDNIPLADYFQPDSTIFIIPSWDEAFVSNFLRKLAIEKGSRKIVVYGLPQWMDFERIDFDYYERLNVHVSSAIHIDAEDYEVREFRRNYFNKTGTVPGRDAFLGYDLTLYFGRLLKDKGKGFIKQIDVNPSARNEYFHTKFEFESDSPSGTDNFSNINKFENKFVNILKFVDFRFQKVN